jgi:hypothetical protein
MIVAAWYKDECSCKARSLRGVGGRDMTFCVGVTCRQRPCEGMDRMKRLYIILNYFIFLHCGPRTNYTLEHDN